MSSRPHQGSCHLGTVETQQSADFHGWNYATLYPLVNGYLCHAKNLSEDAAYTLLRKTAMNENKKIAEIAQSVITAAELFK